LFVPQAEVSSFIDMSALEMEIDRALNTRVSYNWAIDTEGRRYMEDADGSIEVKEALEATTLKTETKDESLPSS
jgi:hypothetical protein